jgi:D-glycero-D-manno-heptose 1,7-bisphosphate phosphatase
MGISNLAPGSRAVFLDRDGVMNRAVVRNGHPYPPASAQDVELVPGSIPAFKKLTEAGYILIGITNQPEVARGTQSRAGVEAINAWLQSRIPIYDMFVCYHDNADDCPCRKPKPGLIFQAAEKYALDLSRSWMVGDRWKDIAAGRAAGLKTVFVDYHYSEIYEGTPATYSVESLESLADLILKGLE